MSSQYLHIQCEAYALLTDIDGVEQVVSGEWTAGTENITWNGNVIRCMDLTRTLTGKLFQGSRHCIIVKNSKGAQRLAVLCGRVNNVQMIADDEFDELPNLDFPFNRYFDKVYIHPSDKRCIYRLRSLFDINGLT